MTNRLTALASGGTNLAMAAPSAPLVDAQARTISGLAVPYGPAGQTSAGRLQFAAGSLAFSAPSRIKLLREHDQRDSVGVARDLQEIDAAEVDRRMTAAGQPPVGFGGLWATFHVPTGENGDRALHEAEHGLRDAFSVGVQLDDRTAERLRRANGAAIQGSGALREVSLVSVPAFDDARVGSVAANAELVVSSWSTTPTPTGDPVRCTVCHHVHAAGVTACQPEHLQASQAALAAASQQPNQPAPVPNPAPTPTPAPTDPAQPTQPAAPEPAPIATAGSAAVVTGEPSTYTFSGDGPGLVADAWAARMLGDGQAAERLQRFNAELMGGNTQSALALAAVLKTTDVSDPDTGMAPNGAFTDVRRMPLREAIDRGRPMLSRINIVPIRNAQPFLLPIEGEFDGVGDHTEGTAHRAEGTLTVDDATMKPKAMSGAFRLSREIIDSTNPAIDRIALRAMLRDYRRKTEAKFLAALATATGAATAVAGPIALDLALLMFGDTDSDEPTFVAGAKQAIANLASYVDNDGRQLLPAVGPTNAPGVRRPGATGYSIGGAELVKAKTITGTDVFAVDEQDVLVAESATQTFRFDEVEGPGIVKLALFGYFGAAVLKDDGVERYSVAAYVAP